MGMNILLEWGEGGLEQASASDTDHWRLGKDTHLE